MNETHPPSAGAARRLPALQPLRRSGFRWLLAGSLASWLGDQFYLIALPWLALQMTGSGLTLGTILMVAAIPRALFMLLGGALSDRFPPRMVMMASSGCSALLTGSFFVLSLSGRAELWTLYALAMALGLVDAVFWPASSAVLPRLVPTDELAPANSALNTLGHVVVFAAPPLAGLLVAAFGTQLAFAVSSACSVLSVLLLSPMREQRLAFPPGGLPSAPGRSTAGLLHEIGEGLRAVWNDRTLRHLLSFSAVWNMMLSGPLLVGAALLSAERFGGEATAFGALMSAYGMGGMIGSLAAGWSASVRRKGTAILLVGALSGCATVGLGLSPYFLVGFAFVAVMTACEAYMGVIAESWIQARVPPALTGRVMSVAVFVLIGLDPASNALAGLVSRAGASVMLFAAGAGTLLTSAVGALSRPLRHLD